MSTTVIEAAAAGDGIEAAIRREHEAASTAAQTALGHALECGRLLAQAREGIAHGGWEVFVRERCGSGSAEICGTASRNPVAQVREAAGDAAAAEPYYNSWLFESDEDYLRRGMGIEPRRKARQGVPA